MAEHNDGNRGGKATATLADAVPMEPLSAAPAIPAAIPADSAPGMTGTQAMAIVLRVRAGSARLRKQRA